MYAGPFLSFCFESGLIPKFQLSSAEDSRDRTGHNELDKSQEKLPDIIAIRAISHIFTQVFDSRNL